MTKAKHHNWKGKLDENTDHNSKDSKTTNGELASTRAWRTSGTWRWSNNGDVDSWGNGTNNGIVAVVSVVATWILTVAGVNWGVVRCSCARGTTMTATAARERGHSFSAAWNIIDTLSGRYEDDCGGRGSAAGGRADSAHLGDRDSSGRV
jgi:hypothetical protein